MLNINLELIEKNPKKALRRLAIPVIILNFIISMYNIVDGIWISGISEAAIVSVATIIPVFSILLGMSTGIGVGTTSTVGYYMGANDRKNAVLACKNAIFLFLIFSVIVTFLLLIILEPLLISYNIGEGAINAGLDYGIPLFLGSFAFVFSGGFLEYLRGLEKLKNRYMP